MAIPVGAVDSPDGRLATVHGGAQWQIFHPFATQQMLRGATLLACTSTYDLFPGINLYVTNFGLIVFSLSLIEATIIDF